MALNDAQECCKPGNTRLPWQPDCGDQVGFDFGEVVELHGLIVTCDCRIDRWPDSRPRKLGFWAAPSREAIHECDGALKGHEACPIVDEAATDDGVLANAARFVFARPVKTRFLGMQIVAGYPNRVGGAPSYVMFRGCEFHTNIVT